MIALVVLSITCLVQLWVNFILLNRLLVKSGIAPIEPPKFRKEDEAVVEQPKRKKIYSVPIEG